MYLAFQLSLLVSATFHREKEQPSSAVRGVASTITVSASDEMAQLVSHYHPLGLEGVSAPCIPKGVVPFYSASEATSRGAYTSGLSHTLFTV